MNNYLESALPKWLDPANSSPLKLNYNGYELSPVKNAHFPLLLLEVSFCKGLLSSKTSKHWSNANWK